jgi:predicted porin
MNKTSVFLAGLLAIYEAGPALAQSAAVNDEAKKELAVMRQEMLQMRNAQKTLQVKIEMLTAAQARAANQSSRNAPPGNAPVVVKGPDPSWLSTVQFPAPPGSTAPNITTVPQIARTSVTGISDTAIAAPGLSNTLSARVLGVDVGLYGFVDLSFDRAHNGQQEWNQVSSNESFLGVAGGVDLGYPGVRAIYQIETMAEVSATPGVGSSIGSRNSFAGISTPYGSLMVGKYDTPYKRSTALMNPFKGSIGDYNSIMGNTAGEGRAEFDYRMPHSIFYDSPNFHGLTVNALYSPGQKLEDLAASSNNAFPQGELVCSGSQQPSLNGATPDAMGTQTLCNDGAFQDAYSVAVNYDYSGLYLTGAYELHKSVNRESDKGGLIANESALKAGASYHFFFGNQLSFIYEYLRREGIPAAGNERGRGGLYVSDVQDLGYNIDLMVAYAHAYDTAGSPKFPGFADYANMYTGGLKYHFNEHASLYLVAAYLSQGVGAHYGLGAGEGHGTPILSPRQWLEHLFQARQSMAFRAEYKYPSDIITAVEGISPCEL